MRALAFSLIVLSAGAARADFAGRVVAVHNGDSLTVLAKDRKVRVRLDGIDAPELSQPYGWAALNALAALCRGKEAKVAERTKDERGRILGTVTCGDTEANAELVKRGLAWVYRAYLPLGSPLYEFETSARLMQRGLWHDKDPVPPWEWRKAHAARQ